MKRVLVESPFAYRHEDPGQRRIGLLRNVTYARLAMRDCILRGEAPLASHLLYTQPFVLDDDVPEERLLGIEAGLVWGAAADLTAVYVDLGLSEGMKHGIANAEKALRPVDRSRRLPGWGADAAWETPRETLERLGLFDGGVLDSAEGAHAGLLSAVHQVMAGPLRV